MSTASPPEPILEQFGYRQELRRGLRTRDLIIYGMIFMVPIAPYSVYGFVWDSAKGRCISDPEADKLIARDYRKPYVV